MAVPRLGRDRLSEAAAARLVSGVSSKPSDALPETNFQETTELGCCPEPRNWVQIFKRGRECVRQAPHGTRLELVVLRKYRSCTRRARCRGTSNSLSMNA